MQEKSEPGWDSPEEMAKKQPGGPCKATDPQELERQIMDPNIPKNEREWWAAREIERLRTDHIAAHRMSVATIRFLEDRLANWEGPKVDAASGSHSVSPTILR
jgi:hypothetical protein